MLSLRNVRAGYGDKEVLRGINLDVRRGTVVTLLGANGAGKTTTLNTVVGLVRRSAGRIDLDGQPLTNDTPDVALRSGVALVAEQRELFLGMSVADNLRLGGLLRAGSREVSLDFERMLDVFPRLRERLTQPARTLSGGEQQMLAIGRALMARPTLLLLDEPSLGLAPKIVDEIFDIIRRISAEGTTILLVEQNAALAIDVADYGYVMETGEITFEGDASALRGAAAVQASYL